MARRRRELRFGNISLVVDILGDGDAVPEVSKDASIWELEQVWEEQGDRHLSGLKLWNTSLVLARFLAREPIASIMRDRKLIEIGAGVGVPGMVAAHHCTHVHLTDHIPQVLELLSSNTALNPAVSHKIETHPLDWTLAVSEELQHAFDIVMLCDVFYEPAMMQSLMQCIDTLLSPKGRLLAITPPEREGAAAFCTLAATSFPAMRCAKLPRRLTQSSKENELFETEYYVLWSGRAGHELAVEREGGAIFHGMKQFAEVPPALQDVLGAEGDESWMDALMEPAFPE